MSLFTNEQGKTLPAVRSGFVDYVRVSRQTPDRAKDALTSFSHYYPDPIIEKDQWNVARDIAQPIWLTASVPPAATSSVSLYSGKKFDSLNTFRKGSTCEKLTQSLVSESSTHEKKSIQSR